MGIVVLALADAPALAEKRVALVIGNSSYQNVTPLTNPANDASAMTTTLKDAGFDVIDSRRNLKASEMKRALRDFSDKARDADVAVVYYAGHGIEIDGTNYLIPVDASLERDIDAFDEAIPLDRILTVMEPAKQLRLAILDACRDNPFNKTMKRTIGTRAVGRGLAKVEPNSPNTLIAFAAKAGSTASDGDSKNSPFTAALIKHLPKPGLDLRKAFGYVRDDVLKATSNKQEPFVYGSLGGNDVTLVPAVAVTTPAPSPASPATDPDAKIRRDYELAERVGTKDGWDYFIANYPKGFYSDLARAQSKKLTAEETRLAATEKAKAAQDEQTRLAIDGAKAAEQAKAAAQARAAEQARVAAELAKKAEEAKVAEAERAKTAAQAKGAEDARVAAEKKKAVDDAKATADARLADERAKAAEQKAKDDKPVGPIAALTPPDNSAPSIPKPSPPIAVADIPRQLQIELRRVGCNTGAIGDTWTAAAQKSLELFNKNAGMKLEVKVASLDSLDAVKGKAARVCPLICEHGYKADSERCTKIVCKPGFEVGDNNNCEKIEAKKPAASPPTVKREEPEKSDKAAKAAAKKPDSAGGSMICSFEIQGCRSVRKGCRPNASGTEEICN